MPVPLRFRSRNFSVGQLGEEPVRIYTENPLDVWQAHLLFRCQGPAVQITVVNLIGSAGFLGSGTDLAGQFFIVVIVSSGGRSFRLIGDEPICRIVWRSESSGITLAIPIASTIGEDPIQSGLITVGGFIPFGPFEHGEVKYAHEETPQIPG